MRILFSRLAKMTEREADCSCSHCLLDIPDGHTGKKIRLSDNHRGRRNETRRHRQADCQKRDDGEEKHHHDGKDEREFSQERERHNVNDPRCRHYDERDERRKEDSRRDHKDSDERRKEGDRDHKDRRDHRDKDNSRRDHKDRRDERRKEGDRDHKDRRDHRDKDNSWENHEDSEASYSYRNEKYRDYQLQWHYRLPPRKYFTTTNIPDHRLRMTASGGNIFSRAPDGWTFILVPNQTGGIQKDQSLTDSLINIRITGLTGSLLRDLFTQDFRMAFAYLSEPAATDLLTNYDVVLHCVGDPVARVTDTFTIVFDRQVETGPNERGEFTNVIFYLQPRGEKPWTIYRENGESEQVNPEEFMRQYPRLKACNMVSNRPTDINAFSSALNLVLDGSTAKTQIAIYVTSFHVGQVGSNPFIEL